MGKEEVLKSLEKMRSYATYDNGMDLTVNTKLRDEFIMTVNNIKKELSKLDEIKEVVNKEPSNSLAKIIAYEYIEKILKEKGW